VSFVVELIAGGAWGAAWSYRIERLTWPDARARYCVTVWPRDQVPTHEHGEDGQGCNLFYTEIQARRAIPDLISKP
jgi:hypothetical protein